MNEEEKKFLDSFDVVEKESYLSKEKTRNNRKKGAQFFQERLNKNHLKCFYCKTDIRVIQALLKTGKIGLRKGKGGTYRGMHFEIEHLDNSLSSQEKDSKENIQNACYYCNNDKSNIISANTFKKYFGKKRGEAFKELFENEIKLHIDNLPYYHNK